MNNVTIGLEVEIQKLYLEDKLSMDKIANKFNLSTCAIQNCLKRLCISRRSLSDAAREYDLDENYFEKIDAPNKSQVLGMIYADGCISERKNKTRMLSIQLKEPDNDYLEFIKKELKYSGKIYNHVNLHGNTMHSLAISSQKLFYDMINLGLTPRKSLTVNFPDENKVCANLLSHFIRGYLEGDGCICVRYALKTNSKEERNRFLSGHVTFCGTIQFLQIIQKIILQELNVTSIIDRKKISTKRNINSYNLRISGNIQVLKFLEWVYKDANFVMPRKYQKYLELKQNIEFKESVKEQLKQEFREKMSKITKGRIVSSETREKQRVGNLEYSKKNRYKEIWIENENGEIYNIRGVKYFCQEFNLPYTFFCAAVNPKNTTHKSCHGWTLYNFDPENPPEKYIRKFY